MSDLPKAYDPSLVEEKWQSRWIEEGCFKADPASEKPAYSVVIPPPNVTGVLHLGHVLNNTIQDILVRRARQKGYEALWLPGTDHAGIATQVRVEKDLKQTTGRSRHDLGREAFLEKVWEWKEKHGGIIINQLHKLGCSCDWDRERFTMDEEYTKAVGQVFIELFKEGLIYRGRRMVNWCPVSLTALSDEEVIMTEQKSKLYTVLYKLEDGSGALHVATTRPETIMADVAVAVNPKDPRYAHLIGKNVMRPLNPTPIPIIGDEYVEIEFGTGALKITPAHDKADFEIGRKFNLEIIDILTPDGHINCPEVPELHGMDRFDARRKSVEMLEASGLMVNVEDYDNKVGFSERANVPIEPRLSMQWFLKYPCVKEAADAVAGGDITFRPARWAKTYAHWLENIQDWCISRQLWWGHRIPVWYRKDKAEELRNAPALDASALEQGFLYVGTEPPQDPDNWIQDNDVMDTWFSSWLWPFSTMDEETRAKFYPTTDLVTGPDIIFFWVARMIMAGYRFQHDKPFSNVFFTSIIRDKIGRKMSKSLGNSPDPLDLIANYGADGLRFGLMRIAPTGTDVRFDENQISEGRNFANKLYNATRFRLMQGDARGETAPHYSSVHISIISKLKQLHADVEKALADYEFNALIQTLYQFFWNEYCDRFLEAVKGDLKDGADPAAQAATLTTMDTVLRHYLALLHPVMPHITEELWASLGFAESNGMIMAGYRFQHDKPFSNVFFTSIIRDKIGRKMSKSLGNSPDPLDLIANYGADGLRFGLMRIAPTGTDVRFDENQISEGRNFANKLYNATRFRLMQGDARGETAPHYSSVHISIISKLKQLHADVEKALADYEFNALIQTLYQFFWNEYCDRFLEAVKGDLKDGADPAAQAATLTTMDTVLRHYLALLHPVMPHITEELWASLGFAESNGGLPLMRTPLPSAENLLAGLDESRITLANTQAAALYETANKARNLKAEYDLSNNKNVSFILKTPHDVPQDILSRLAILANAKSVIRDAAYSSPKGTPAALTPLGELFLPLEGLIDVEAEKERLGRELDKIAREIAKSAAKLGNAGFVERAPAEVVNQEKARLADWEAKQSQLKGMLDSLS